jgi:hypothetical protein
MLLLGNTVLENSLKIPWEEHCSLEKMIKDDVTRLITLISSLFIACSAGIYRFLSIVSGTELYISKLQS